MTDAIGTPAARFGAPAALGPIMLLVLWEGLGHLPDLALLVAPPSAILLYLWTNAGLMARALTETLTNAAWGFAAGNLAAIALAALAMLLPRAERIVAGLALLVFCLPLVATGPILRVLYGPGPGPQITLAALAVYYTTFVPLLVGLRAAPSTWFDLVRSYGRGRGAALIHVRTMASLPYLFAGLQIAAPAAVLGAMVGEFTGAERGMGVLTVRAMRALDVDATWALATVAAAISTLAYAGVGALGRRMLPDAPPVILSPPREPGRAARWWQAPLRALAVLAVALVAWWAAMALSGLSPFFAKRPGDVWDALVSDADAAQTRATLLAAMAQTGAAVVPGYLAGLALGAGLAVALVLRPGIASVAMPVAVALRAVPIVTTAPLVVLALGRGMTGSVTLVAVMVFFPAFVACLHGLARAPGQAVDVFDAYAAGPVARMIHLRLPAMLPAFFAAARMTVPAAVLAVTVVEWLATGQGVGALMALSASLSDYDMLWSAVVVVAVLSAAGYAAVGWVEARVLARFAPEQLA